MRFTGINYVIALTCLHADALNQFELDVIWKVLQCSSVTWAIARSLGVCVIINSALL